MGQPRPDVARIRHRDGVALWGGLVAGVLLAFAASAQEVTDGGKAPTSGAAVVDEAEGGAAPDASAAEAEPSAPDAALEPDEDLAEPAPTTRTPLPAPTIEEIEVVGRRMKIEVPDPTVSAVGFDPSELKAEGINDIRDLSNFTPSWHPPGAQR
jgi:hypothetical protein